ncbi:MAG: flavin reductase family protein [Campylobacteraceae bacterium]|jgi:flavin reductase (DIM6/NTAB) family NADH-FMN oxidoreductase RutF|nr:flavin reductase family protein [Campylobacteraceae bacterium]
MRYHNFAEVPLYKAFEFIEPGPVILLVTSEDGKPNIMTLSWSVLIDFDPIIGCVLSPGDYSYEILRKTKECVLAIPAADIIEKAVQIGNCSGEDTDKFQKFALSPLKASHVKAPLIKECLVNIECIVTDIIDKYGLFVMEGVKAWIDKDKSEKRTFHANGDGTFVIDGEIKNLKHLMTKWQQFT